MKKAIFISLLIALVSVCYAAGMDGKSVFAKCQGCHGANGEKKALGTSAVIKGMPAAEVEKKLNAFKTGKFTDSKANIMQKQAASLSGPEIKAVADYISKL